MVRVELLKMSFEIDIRNFGSSQSFKTSLFVKIIIDLLLKPHKSFIFPRNFESHQILRNQLLRLNLMKMFREGNEVSCGFFGILQLLELNHQNVVKLLEILPQMIDPYLLVHFEFQIFMLAL